MKKAFHKITAVLLLIALLIPNITVFAAEVHPEWQDANLTEEEFNAVLANNPSKSISPYVSGLIYSYAVAIKRTDNIITIAGSTSCSAEVVKCGFKELIVQQKAPSSTKWTDYLTYEDIYMDSFHYLLMKDVVVPSGYDYRVVCTHYAKKNLLSTQKIDNVSNTVYVP